MELIVFVIAKELVKSCIDLMLYIFKLLPQQFLLSPWDHAQGFCKNGSREVSVINSLSQKVLIFKLSIVVVFRRTCLLQNIFRRIVKPRKVTYRLRWLNIRCMIKTTMFTGCFAHIFPFLDYMLLYASSASFAALISGVLPSMSVLSSSGGMKP